MANAGNEMNCLLQCGKACNINDSVDNVTREKWSSMKEKSKKWQGLKNFGQVHNSVDWEKGPRGFYMHRSCYATLSNKRALSQAERRRDKEMEQELENTEMDSTPSNECSAPKRLRSSIGPVHDKTCCVWCMKDSNQKKPSRDNKLLLLSTEDAWNKFKLHTVYIEDDTMRQRLSTLIDNTPTKEKAFGIEIRYHRGCWRKYVSDHITLTDETAQHLQGVNLREAQSIFFNHVRQVILNDHELRTLQGLLNDYKRIISNFGHDSVVKSSYLKELLIKEFGEGIGFHQRNQKNVSEVVYDTAAGGTYIEAAISSFGISDEQLTKNVAARLQQQVLGTKTLPWPPFIHELEKEENLNELLLKLITWMKHPNKTSIDDSPTVRTISSFLTSYITGNHTTSQANIAVLLHGLTKCREIVDVMHKFGLGISYDNVLMLRDFWVVNDQKRSLNCPFEIAEGKPGVILVDNDDFRSDTLTGANPNTHRTNVCYVQPTSWDVEYFESDGDRPVPCNPRKLATSLSVSLKEFGSEMQKINPYKTMKRGEPPVRQQPEDDSMPDTLAQRTRGVIHALARAQDDRSRSMPEKQVVPGFSGFQANMSEPVEKSRAIYHMTYPDPPSKTILYDVMCKVAKSIDEKKMPFAVVVGDQPIYVLLLELKSENLNLFDKIFPFWGPFHIQMSFINAIYKRFNGSGISDILVAAGVIAEGSVDHALRGKHFKRGLRGLRLFYETLIHHALNKRLDGSPPSGEIRDPIAKLRRQTLASKDDLAKAYAEIESNLELKTLVDTLFKDYADCQLAQYWMSFLEMVEILTQNIHALRTRHWLEFKSSIKLMLPWMKIYDNDKYGRHLPYFSAVLDDLPDEQAAYMENGLFAQSMTGNPYSCVALDIWIESTMNKGSKLKSGWLAILNNEKQLLSNTRNVNNVNRVRATVHRHADRKKNSKGKHADSAASKIKTDEQAIQDLSECLIEFKCDPFDYTNQTLRSLQSGIRASEILAADFKSAKEDGMLLLKEFLEKRVYSKAKSLYDRVPRSRRKNFATQEVKKIDNENMKKKTQEMEAKAIASVLGIIEKSGSFKLEQVLEHRVTEESLSIFNANGTMRKVQKSKLQQKLTMTPIPEPDAYTTIVDMGLIWRLTAPTIEDREKGDGTKYTWGDYREKVVRIVLARHKNADRIICVNDPYDQTHTIKDTERMMRQQGAPIKNVYMKSEDKFPTIKDFHLLLGKAENKIRLQEFLGSGFQRTADKSALEIIYCIGDRAKNLSTGQPTPQFACSHAEADTAMFFIYSVLRSEGYTRPVILDTEDTDNYVQAANVAQLISGLLCLKRKTQLITAQCLCSKEMADWIIPLHIITGNDHNSGFYGVSKKVVADRIQSCKEARDLLALCGTELTATKVVLDDLEKFVIRYLYCDAKNTTLADVRAAKWRAQKKKNTLRLAPDSDSLRLHLQRTNYLSFLLKHPSLQLHPSPIGHGWHLVDGLCLPVRYNQPPLPSSITLPLNPIDEVDTDMDSEYASGSESDSNGSSLSSSDDYDNA